VWAWAVARYSNSFIFHTRLIIFCVSIVHVGNHNTDDNDDDGDDDPKQFPSLIVSLNVTGQTLI